MHSRFSATARTYRYYIHSRKNPFLNEISWFYPFTLQHQLLHEAAAIVLLKNNFIACSKKNTQVDNYLCTIQNSFWEIKDDDTLVYCITANRFLRGMVRALVSTLLQVGRGAISLDDFRAFFDSQQIASANFSSPAHGLFLEAVHYPIPLVPVVFEAL
jgi:tRNA pseudouridine38-40 synthase